MTWYEAVLATLGIVMFWFGFLPATTWISERLQRRMDRRNARPEGKPDATA